MVAQYRRYAVKMRIPTERELAGEKPYCLDTEWMLKNFLGKSIQEAFEFIIDNNVSFDYTYMTKKGFMYYGQAALKYLKSVEICDDEYDFTIQLLCSLTCRIDFQELDRDELEFIKEIGSYCFENAKKLDLDITCDIYQQYVKKIQSA